MYNRARLQQGKGRVTLLASSIGFKYLWQSAKAWKCQWLSRITFEQHCHLSQLSWYSRSV